MFDIFYHKLKNCAFLENLENTVDAPQNYIPIYKEFFDLSETNYNQISLNQKYHIMKASTSASTLPNGYIEETEDVLYKMSTMDAVLESAAAEKVKRQIFIKYSPVLDPIKYMIGKYDLSDTRLRALPQLGSTTENCLPKVLNSNNSSYIDGFFTYLTSQLLNHHGFIHGVDYYGSYMGIQRKYKMNVMEDIEYMKSSSFFRKNIGSLFEIDNPYSNDISDAKYENSRNCKTRLDLSTEVAADEIEIDDIEDLTAAAAAGPTIESDEVVSPPSPATVTATAAAEIIVEYDKTETQSITSVFSESDSDDDSSLNYTSDEGEEKSDFPPTKHTKSDTDPAADDEQSYSTSSSNSESDEDIIATIYNFPVHMIALEKCEGTLDELMIYNAISDEEWRSALFQVIITLAVLQKSFYLTHNDLHTNNIMFVPTKHKFIYYKIENHYFKVPTYGKIYKIIDFGRAIYTYRGRLFCSDSFETHGDAAGQYNFPPFYDEKKPVIEPNYSFDLCRLGCSIYDCMIDADEEYADMSALKKMIYDWCCDDNGKNVIYKKNGEERYPDFKLYKIIARTVHKHTPLAELSRPFFRKYLCTTGAAAAIEKEFSAAKLSVDIDSIPCYAPVA